MDEPHIPDPHQNPYYPFEEPGCYRAFKEGWVAHHLDKPRTAFPYPLSQSKKALAWLDGWTAADQGTPGLPVCKGRSLAATQV